ncbi:MAG: FtsK/SpoIIIE domain-containing protein [Muribaculaceae bacterium]|nr:FtsK/SpoIIIE domain-containing protein [Muribaculaceae bacterium]
MTKQSYHEYIAPDLELLSHPVVHQEMSPAECDEKVKVMQDILESYGIGGRDFRMIPGPLVSNYRFQPNRGVRMADIRATTEDIARALATNDRIIVNQVPFTSEVNIAVPNFVCYPLHMGDLMCDKALLLELYSIPWVVGLKSADNIPKAYDLTEMENVVVLGRWCSGKSALLQSLVLSVVYNCHPSLCQLVLIDPKGDSFIEWDGIPHLAMPVATGVDDGAFDLQYVAHEIRRRLEIRRIRDDTDWPRLVIVVDDAMDLMRTSDKDIEYIVQFGARANVHLVVAMRELMNSASFIFSRANVPVRVSFWTDTSLQSIGNLGTGGAEKLQLCGDILVSYKDDRPVRVNTPVIDADEIKRVADFLRTGGDYATEGAVVDDQDLYQRAKAVVIRGNKPTISYIQRNFNIGYNKVANILDRMEQDGIVSAPNENGKRYLISKTPITAK